MGVSAGARSRAALALLALLAAAAAVDGLRLWRAWHWNAVIVAAASGNDAANVPPQVLLARAAAHAAAERDDLALALYGQLRDRPEVASTARFNAANLLLRQAIAARADGRGDQAVALIELAKEGYRELLRRDPADWDARYNLERAQRLQPDPEGEDPTPLAPPTVAERAADRMRGYVPGLP